VEAEAVVFFEGMNKLIGMCEGQSIGQISDVMKSEMMESEMREEKKEGRMSLNKDLRTAHQSKI
jgi:hypothetical protein